MTLSLHTVFFSPTGSSRRIAQETARVLEQELAQNMALARDDDWDWTFPEGRAAARTPGPEDVLLFAFPVYAGRIPQVLRSRWQGWQGMAHAQFRLPCTATGTMTMPCLKRLICL